MNELRGALVILQQAAAREGVHGEGGGEDGEYAGDQQAGAEAGAATGAPIGPDDVVDAEFHTSEE